MVGTSRHAPDGGTPFWVLLLVIVAVIGGALTAASLGAVTSLSGHAHDALIDTRNGDRAAPGSVVLIDVDERTVSEQGQLPLIRTSYAEAIDELTRLGARAITIDVQFTEPTPDDVGDPDTDPDADLLEAIERTDVPVVLGTSQVRPNGDTTVLGGRANLEPAGAVAAHTAQPTDPDFRIRRLDRQVDGLVTMAQATARAAGRPGLLHDATLLDPTIPATKLRTVSMQDLLDGKASAEQVRGRIAVIGVTVVGPTGDDRIRTAGSTEFVPGVAVQAQAIDTALRGEPLRGAGTLGAYLLAILAALSATLGVRRGLWVQLLVTLLAAVAIVLLAVVLVKSGLLLDPVPALVALIAASLGAMAVRAESERRRRAAARATLGRFVPPGVVDELLEGDRDGRIAPQAQQASVLFCDLRGYTALVASLHDPQALIEILDVYLSAVTETVHRHGGTVVSFQGDGVMSAFGTPVRSERSAAQAVAAAQDLQTVALPQVRAGLRSVVEGADALRLGVGVSTGPVFAGTVGPPDRREYAVVGPTTNLAARLQALTKTEGVSVVVDGATAAAARGDAGAGLTHLGPREIRGLDEPVEVWTLEAPGDASPARSDA